MGWLNTLTFGLLGDQEKGVTFGEGDVSDFTLQLLGFSNTPDRGDEERLAAFHSNSALYTVQHATSEAFAAVPWTVKRDGDPVPDHPLQKLIDRPNPHMSGYTYRYVQQAYRDLLGESFAEIRESDDSERPFDLYPIPPTAVTIRRAGKRYVAEVNLGDRRDVLEMDEVIWSSKPDLRNPYGRGTGLGDVLSQELDGDEFAQDFVNAFFHNDATPSIMLGFPRGAGENQVRNFQDKMEARHRGSHKSHRPMAHRMGDELIVERLSTEFKHLDIADLRQFFADVIRRVYNVPPEIIGQTQDSNQATSKVAREHMAVQNTRPRLRLQKDEWKAKLHPRLDARDVTLEHGDPTPSRRDHVRESMKNHPWAFTVNEIRETADKPPRADGDVYMRPAPTKLQPEDAGDLIVDGKMVKALPDLTDEAELIDDGADVLEFPIQVKDGGMGDSTRGKIWQAERDLYLQGGES